MSTNASLRTTMSPSSPERPWLRAVQANEAPGQKSGLLEPTDDELIEAVVQGDAKVAGKIHDRLIRVIDHTLYRVLGRREHDHDDLVQSSFEQILRTLATRSFAGNCSLRTWAGRITTHVALNALRSRQRERKVIHRSDSDYDASPSASVNGNAEARVELDRVRVELSKMRPSRAEVFVLHDVHGYSLAEIASMMDLSVSATQSRLVRGRNELHSRLRPPKSLLPWRRHD